MCKLVICDKCSKPVKPWDDAVLLQGIINPPSTIGVPMTVGRHLLPVSVGGKVVCEGSPSCAQYLPGQARDERSEGYAYIPEVEATYRAAYINLLQRHLLPLMENHSDLTVYTAQGIYNGKDSLNPEPVQAETGLIYQNGLQLQCLVCVRPGQGHEAFEQWLMAIWRDDLKCWTVDHPAS